MQFGCTVEKLRIKHKMSREKLAARVGVNAAVVEAWETGEQFPDQEHLLLLAQTLKVGIGTLVDGDRELMLKVIDGTETQETVTMAVVSALLAISAGALFCLTKSMPETTQIATRITEVLLIAGFAVLAYIRRSPNAMRAKGFRDAIEAAEGSEKGLIQVTAGRNTKLVIMQFVLGAIIAATLIVLLGVIMPESQLPWVML